jgi:high affinity sulfate transporter 1
MTTTAGRGRHHPWSVVRSAGRRANLVSGLTVTAYLVPQVMAYARVAGLAPQHGLWACLPALVLYAFLGTSRLLSVGPESSVALMTAAVVAPLAAGDPQQYPALAAALALAVAAVCLLASVLRLSFLADLLSRPVLVGYMAGIAVLMIMGQLGAFLGIRLTGGSIFEELGSVAAAWSDIRWDAVAVGAVVIGAVVLLSRWPKLPGPLLAIAAAAVAVQVAGSDLALVGEVPAGLPLPALPGVDAAQAQALLVGALGVAVVGFTDMTLTARAFRERTDPEVRPAAELRAVAAANAGAGLLQGLPVSASGSRTALASNGRASSQGYSLVAAAALALVLLVAGPLLAELPRAALAGLVVYAAVRLIDIAELRRLWQFRRTEFGLAAFTFGGVLVLGVLYGVLAAVAVSVLDLLARVARPHAAALGFAPGLAGMHDVADFPGTTEVPGLLVFRYDSPLFFANAEDFRRRAMAEVARHQPGLRWFALNCEAIVEIDSTAVDALDEVRRDLHDAGVRMVLVRAKQELLHALGPTGFVGRLGPDAVYPTLPVMVAAFRQDR